MGRGVKCTRTPACAHDDVSLLVNPQVGIEFAAASGGPCPVPAADFAAASAQIQALRRAAPDLVVTSAQARMVAAECFKVRSNAGAA